jgi:ferredoxin
VKDMVEFQKRDKNDILGIPILGFIFKNPTFLLMLKLLVLALFIYGIVFGFLYPDKSENIFTKALFWTLFWPFFIVITLPTFGRIFCGICPHGFMGKYITKFGLQKKMPQYLDNPYIGITLLIVGFWVVYYIAPGTYKTPLASAIFFLVLTLLSIVFFFFYKDMGYCKNICPIGTMMRGFSKVSFTKLETYKKSCNSCKTFECANVCPYNLKPFTFEKRNSMTDCTLCMDCADSCEAVAFKFVKPSKSLFGKFQIHKPEVWAVILITAAISITMSFHHALGRVAISDQFIWSKMGVWLESQIGIAGLDYIGISALFCAMVVTLGLATFGIYIASKFLKEDYSKVFYTLSYAFIPLFIIGGLSHTFEFFFLHHYHNIANGFMQGFGVVGEKVAPLATRKDTWLRIFTVMNYIAVIWAFLILYKRLQFFNGTKLVKTGAFIFASSLILFYLGLNIYKLYAFAVYGVKKGGHMHHGGNGKMFQSVPFKDAVILQTGKDKYSCSICGMKLPMFYKTNHTATLPDGKVIQYCSAHCLQDHKHTVKTNDEKVVDVSSLEFIDAKKAFYVVGSRQKGTMSMVSKYAFKLHKNASEFQKKFGGKIVNYSSAMEIVKKDFKK